MNFMSLRVYGKQSPHLQGGCFATYARNDMCAKVNALREVQSASGDASQVAPALWAPSGVGAVTHGRETMKLFHLSWVLGMLSYIIGGVFRRSESPLGEMLIGIPGLAIFLLLILPAGIGTV